MTHWRQPVVDMINEGKIPMLGGVFIDAYNKSFVKDCASTVTTAIYYSNNYFVTSWEL